MIMGSLRKKAPHQCINIVLCIKIIVRYIVLLCTSLFVIKAYDLLKMCLTFWGGVEVAVPRVASSSVGQSSPRTIVPRAYLSLFCIVIDIQFATGFVLCSNTSLIPERSRNKHRVFRPTTDQV